VAHPVFSLVMRSESFWVKVAGDKSHQLPQSIPRVRMSGVVPTSPPPVRPPGTHIYNFTLPWKQKNEIFFFYKLGIYVPSSTKSDPTRNNPGMSFVHYLSFLGAFVKLRKATISFVMSVLPSVCPQGTTRLPRDEFSWNMIFVYFSKNLSRKYNVIYSFLGNSPASEI